VQLSEQVPLPWQVAWQLRVHAEIEQVPLLPCAQSSVQPLPAQLMLAAPAPLLFIWQLPPAQSREQEPLPLQAAAQPP
jgi:hypothetical protein